MSLRDSALDAILKLVYGPSADDTDILTRDMFTNANTSSKNNHTYMLATSKEASLYLTRIVIRHLIVIPICR